jgi:N-acetyl-1-D-myo-inositol-2-amino-2-deoxy-alpha-D-glucopyranoside deacetylase
MTMLLVHPHPDDESILTGGAILLARAAGTRVVLVTATRGERGGVSQHCLAEVRSAELRAACSLLGIDRHVFLGYRDSGTEPALASADPRSFTGAPLAEVAGRLAHLLREERPEVVITATPDGTYGHPDHVRAHDATVAALALLEDEGWHPVRVAMVALPRGPIAVVAQGMLALGLGPRRWLQRRAAGPGPTCLIRLGHGLERKRSAVRAHASQLRGTLALVVRWPLLFRVVFGVERFRLAPAPGIGPGMAGDV